MAFHVSVIEEALRYIEGHLAALDSNLSEESATELGAACGEALEALAELRTRAA